jgi:hypothetical protein
MTLSRRSFLKGLAALPLVAAFLPKEAQASVSVYLTKGNSLGKTEFKKFGTESSRFDGSIVTDISSEYHNLRKNELIRFSTRERWERLEYRDGYKWKASTEWRKCDAPFPYIKINI